MKDRDVRQLEIGFNALTPTMIEVPRRIVVSAVKIPESSDVVMLIAGSTYGRWKKEEKTFQGIADSFEVP